MGVATMRAPNVLWPPNPTKNWPTEWSSGPFGPAVTNCFIECVVDDQFHLSINLIISAYKSTNHSSIYTLTHTVAV